MVSSPKELAFGMEIGSELHRRDVASDVMRIEHAHAWGVVLSIEDCASAIYVPMTFEEAEQLAKGLLEQVAAARALHLVY